MSTLERPTTTPADDAAAIEELHEIVGRQRDAFLADPFPSLDERRALLAALAGMVMSHRAQIEEAMSADFGVHPTLATDLIEVLGVAGRAAYAAEQLEAWMASEPRYSVYVFSQDEQVADDVLRRTTSGGACVNAAAVHGALPSLPFGGIGQSGSGRHHGLEGFREFSNLRAVFVRGEGDMIEAFAPPYGATAQAVVDAAFEQAGQ